MNAPLAPSILPAVRLPSEQTSLAPDSLIWRYFGDRRVLLVLGAGFILQSAHPVIGKGVADHSSFKTDPHGRMKRSLALLWPVIYNTSAGAAEYGHKLRELHRPIKGTGFDGKPYHALNPDGYLWVHASAYDGIISFAAFLGEDLNEAQRAQLFQEWLQMGRQLGLRDEDMPRSVAEYAAYMEDTIVHRLARNETLDYLMREEYFTNQTKPPEVTMPDWLYQPVSRFMGRVAWLCTRGSMPESFRKKFDIPFTARDARNYRLAGKVVRLLWPLLPERRRWLPQAWRAIVDARAHPEKYPPVGMGLS